MNARQWEREWKKLKKSEKAFLERNCTVQPARWQEKIEQHVPEKLNDTLKAGFCKAFRLIFDKGTGIIETTYNRKKKEENYKINEYTARVKSNRRSLRAFERQAKGSKGVNMAVSTVEGIGMGVIGMGIPDIPVFIGVVLKGIYEIALSYGFSYDTQEEQIFILKLIETSLSHGTDLLAENAELDTWIREPFSFEVSRKEQIQKTADVLAEEMLYLKFIQGIPLVGVAGGLFDVVYQKKITDFAELKYHKRFLEKYGRELGGYFENYWTV